MKIIGTTGKKGLIVEMTVVEIKNICGDEYFSDNISFFDGDKIKHDCNPAGSQLDVSKIFRDSKETLTAWSVMQTSLKSISTQISTLLKKMKNDEEDE